MLDVLAAEIVALESNELDHYAATLAPLLDRLNVRSAGRAPAADGWMSTRQAAEHLGISMHAIHRLTAAREVPFSQDGPGCRCWFRRSELDRWRQGGSARPSLRRAA
jgi:excisionase family DNA binding protein